MFGHDLGRGVLGWNLLWTVAFAAVVVTLGWAVTLTIPLFVALNPLLKPNLPQLPLVPFAAALAFLALRPRPLPTSLVMVKRAAVLAVGAIAIVALTRTVAMAQAEGYLTLPYRLYGLVFLAVATAAVVTLCGVAIRRGDPSVRDELAVPLVAVLAVVWAESLFQGELIVAAAQLGGVVLAMVGSRAQRWLQRWRPGAHAVLIATVTVGFAFRVIFGFQTLARTGPGMAFARASDDGDSYFTNATRMIADPSAISAVLGGNAGFPPAYALFLAILLGPTGGSLHVVIVAQALLAALSTVLVYAIARTFAPRLVALIAAGLFAVDQNLIQDQATLTAESLLLPVVLGAVFGTIRYGSTGAISWMAIAALATALAFVTRNVVGGVLLLSVALWLAVHSWRRPKVLARDIAMVIAAIVLFTAPIALVTAQSEGKPRVTNQLAGLGFEYVSDYGLVIENGILLERGINPFKDPAGSASRVVADPFPVLAFFAYAVPQRLSALLFSATHGATDPLTVLNPITHPSPFGDAVELLLFLALALAVALFVVRRPDRRAPAVGLLVTYALVYVAIFTLVFPPRQPFRYRIPVEPVAMIAEAVGLAALLGMAVAAWRRDPVAQRTPGSARVGTPE